jgi:hypothetical protein
MGVIDWLLSIRKKPLVERRRFVAFFAVLFMVGISALWLFLTVTVGPLKFEKDQENVNAATPNTFTLPEVSSFPSLSDFSGL